jgi:hypothetical protein
MLVGSVKWFIWLASVRLEKSGIIAGLLVG